MVLQTDCSWLGYGLPLKLGVWLLIKVPLGVSGGSPDCVVGVPLPVSPSPLLALPATLSVVELLDDELLLLELLSFELDGDCCVVGMVAVFATGALWKRCVVFVASSATITTTSATSATPISRGLKILRRLGRFAVCTEYAMSVYFNRNKFILP